MEVHLEIEYISYKWAFQKKKKNQEQKNGLRMGRILYLKIFKPKISTLNCTEYT